VEVISIMGMADVEWARKKGASDQQIARYLASTRNYRLKEALEAGVPIEEIINYLAPQSKVGSKSRTESREVKTEWKPSHKIVCKVYTDKQDVVYWVEDYDGKERSPLYKMKKCIIADSDNWEGEMDYHSSFWPTRVEVVNGKLKFDGLELTKVGWWKWNFDKESFQSSAIISTTWFVWNNHLVWAVVGIGILLSILFGWRSNIEEKKRETAEYRPKMADPIESLEEPERILCSDRNCVGTINEKGFCNICKKPRGAVSSGS
jgi:hypothetical protein